MTAEQAGVREVAEELGLTIVEPKVLHTLGTSLEGKRETLTTVPATTVAAESCSQPRSPRHDG